VRLHGPRAPCSIRCFRSCATPSAGMRHGRRPGASRTPSPPTTSWSSAAAGTDWRPPIISRSEFGLTNVAVLEKGWLGGGQYRSQHDHRSLELPSARQHPFYELAMKLWESLSHEINYNVMFSQRGVLNLFHSARAARRLCAARQCDAPARRAMPNSLGREEVRRRSCRSSTFLTTARFPIVGGLLQRRGGTARHDAVAWGYARAADRLGVDVVQNCEVNGFLREGDRVIGVSTTRGEIRAGKVALAAAGNSSRVAETRRPRSLPIESHVLQAFVIRIAEAIRCDGVVTFGAGHLYMSASPTRADSSSAATSTATIPTPSAATCPSSKRL
jgi:methylglutamate dehydrogenase subunit A